MSIIGPTRPAIIPPIARATGEGGLPWEAETGGVTWLPSMMPGTFFLGDASQVALVGSDVDILEDQVSTGAPSGDQDLTAPLAASRPAYSAASSNMNGEPSMVFTAATPDNLIGATAANWTCLHDGTGGSWAAVLYTAGASGAVDIFMSTADGAGAGTKGIYCAITLAGKVRIIIANGNGTAYSLDNIATSIAAGTHILIGRYDESQPTDYSLRIDGTVGFAADTVAAPSALAPTSALAIGSNSSRTAAASFGGEISYVQAAAGYWTDSQCAVLEGYLATRYGVTLP